MSEEKKEFKRGDRVKIDKVFTYWGSAEAYGYDPGTVIVREANDNPWYVEQSRLVPYVEPIEDGDLVHWQSSDGMEFMQGVVSDLDKEEGWLDLTIGSDYMTFDIDECTLVKKASELDKCGDENG